MLAALGLLTILAVLAGILSKKVSPMIALIAFPIIGGLMAGKGSALGGYIASGITTVAPMAAMFLFAILFFGLMADVGLFKPAVTLIVKTTKGNPASIAVGTVLLASIVHLDGSGASTFMIAVPALLPLYDSLGMDRRLLAASVAMAAGVGNMLPWGGPTIRAATALDIPVIELFMPLLPVYATGLASALVFAWFLGQREKRRLAAAGTPASHEDATQSHAGNEERLTFRFFINVLIVLLVVAALFSGVLPPAGAFMIGLVIAALVNAPGLKKQDEVLKRHAPAAISMVAILFAAGVFTGIMRGSGMLEAVSTAGAGILPDGAASTIPVWLAVLSVPLSLLFDPDSFYFGILPVLADIGAQGGVPIDNVAHAALMGQMTAGFPVSPMTPATFLLVGLARIELADHQRFSLPLLFGISMIMTVMGLMLGVI